MGSYEQRMWVPSAANDRLLGGRNRSDQYSVYLPDRMDAYPSSFSNELTDHLNDSAVYIAKVDTECAHASSKGLRHLLTRVESLASSLIEGHYVSPQNLIEAEVIGTDDVDAKATLNNIAVMEAAMREVAGSEKITHEHLIGLQSMLLPELPRGYREVQNWIGGSNYSPAGAAHVPPPPEDVEIMMDDLLRFVNGTRGNPLVNAALAHAQFESIHPFIDGNGRTGRALIHVMLHRAGLTENSILPISAVLSRTKRSYITGLHSVRGKGAPDAQRIEDWIDNFTHTSNDAATKTLRLIEQAEDLDEQWVQRIVAHRSSHGMRALRSDSVVNRITGSLMANPCLTAESAAKQFEVSHTAAATALNDLHEVGILSRSRDYSSRNDYFTALEVSTLIAQLQRVNSSAMDDARLAVPFSSASAKSLNSYTKNNYCDRYMPIARTNCRRGRNHAGQCRS